MNTDKVSIIIPCYLLPDKNQELLTFTQNCINSIADYVDNNPFELVLVDNGSPIGDDYLRGVADIYIRNQENEGFAVAVNQGLKLATSEWLVVCNNDVEFIGSEKTLTGCAMGATRLDTDVPKLAELYKAGYIKLDELITGRFPLEKINEAIEEVEKGKALRNVIVF